VVTKIQTTIVSTLKYSGMHDLDLEKNLIGPLVCLMRRVIAIGGWWWWGGGGYNDASWPKTGLAIMCLKRNYVI